MGTGGIGDALGQQSGVAESQIHRLFHRAFDLGINFFDTAPAYLESEPIGNCLIINGLIVRQPPLSWRNNGQTHFFGQLTLPLIVTYETIGVDRTRTDNMRHKPRLQ